MTALTRARNTPRFQSENILAIGQKGSTTLYPGALCVIDAGYLAPGRTATGLIAVGRFRGSRASTNAGASGSVVAEVDQGIFPWVAGDSITAADVGKDAWVADDQTVYLASTGRSKAGTIVKVDDGGVWVATGIALAAAVQLVAALTASQIALVDLAALFTATDVESALAEAKLLIDAGLSALKKTVTVGHADLTAAVNGTAQAVSIGTALPANARIIAANIKLATPFAGGSASAVSVDIGTSGDIDAIVDGADVFAAAVDGQASSRPLGIAPQKHFASGGAQLIATFAPDGGHTLDGLTAGACTIEVLYIVLA